MTILEIFKTAERVLDGKSRNPQIIGSLISEINQFDVKQYKELVKVGAEDLNFIRYYLDGDFHNTKLVEYPFWSKFRAVTDKSISTLTEPEQTFARKAVLLWRELNALTKTPPKKELLEDYMTAAGLSHKQKILDVITPLLKGSKGKKVANVLNALIAKKYIDVEGRREQVYKILNRDFECNIISKQSVNTYLAYGGNKADYQSIIDQLP